MSIMLANFGKYAISDCPFISVCPSVCLLGYVAWEWWEFRWSNKWNWYSSGLHASIVVWPTCASALSGWVLYRQLELTKLSRTVSRLASCCGFVHTERRPSELGISMRTEGSKNISPWFSRFISDSITWDVDWEWWEFRWSNKWNWYSSRLHASILVWHTCASALSGWVLYRQLELTKLTRPDLHMLWVCSYWETSVRAWNIHARWGF